MPWQPTPVPRWFQKVLARGADGEPSVAMNYVALLEVAPGREPDAAGRYRQMRKGVREYETEMVDIPFGWLGVGRVDPRTRTR